LEVSENDVLFEELGLKENWKVCLVCSTGACNWS
jgi:hypothetical protein